MNRLRALLSHTHVDTDGRAVVYADRVAACLDFTEGLIHRLVVDLGTARGRTVAQIEAQYGLGEPERRSGAPRAGSGAVEGR